MFSALSVELDWPAATSRHTAFVSAVNVPTGSGCADSRVKLRKMKTNSALVEQSEEDVFDTRSEDESLAEQNQWCPFARALLSLQRGTRAREGAGS